MSLIVPSLSYAGILHNLGSDNLVFKGFMIVSSLRVFYFSLISRALDECIKFKWR